MTKGFFITGTDTDVGKTWVTIALMIYFKKHGYSVTGMKPVAAGCQWQDGQWKNSDALMIQNHGSKNAAYHLINPYAFELPVSPHLAAKNGGVKLSVIKQAFDELKSQADVILVEGAGGWLAPINFESDIADLAIVTELPVILVVGIKLGCINHARISYQAIRASGVSCVGWVAVCLDPEMSLIDENIGTLKNKISAPLLAVMPFVKEQDFERLAKNLEKSGLI